MSLKFIFIFLLQLTFSIIAYSEIREYHYGDLFEKDVVNTWDIQFITADHGWLATNYGLLRTTDGGITWERLDFADKIIENSWLIPVELRFIDSQVGYARMTYGEFSDSYNTSNSYLCKTVDGGENWTILNTLPQGNVLCFDFIDKKNGVAVTEMSYRENYLYNTKDGGITWHRSNEPVPLRYIVTDVKLQDNETAHLLSSIHGTFYPVPYAYLKTADDGKTWQYIEFKNAIPNVLYPSPTWNIFWFLQRRKYDSYYSNQMLLYDGVEIREINQRIFDIAPLSNSSAIVLSSNSAGLDPYLARTDDRGETFQKICDLPQYPANEIEQRIGYASPLISMPDEGTIWVLGWADKVVKCTIDNVGINSSTQKATPLVLFPAKPNPFNPITTIPFTLVNETDITLTIYNIAGEKVATLADGRFSAGEHSVDWNASEFASGVYFYRLTAGAFEETRKMTVVK